MPKKTKIHAAIHPQQVANMYNALQKIAKAYQTPEQLRRNSEKQFGVEYEEALEMAYENLQWEAASAVKGVRIKEVQNQLQEISSALSTSSNKVNK